MIKRKQRIPMRDLSTMTAEDRTTVEKNAMNGQVFNIFKVLAHHPALVKRWTPFAGHILSKQTLPFRDRELLILRIGWLNQAEYEFAQHELIARRGGLSDSDIAQPEGRARRPRAGASTRPPCCRSPTISTRTRSSPTRPGPCCRRNTRPSSSWTPSSPSASTISCRGP